MAGRYGAEYSVVRKCGDLLVVTYNNGVQVVRVFDFDAVVKDRERFPGGEKVVFTLVPGSFVIVVYEYKRRVVGVTLYTC